MFRKICTRCINHSYSSTKKDHWQCPYCGYDLKEEKAIVVDHTINFSTINNLLEQKRGMNIYRNQL
ncbi:hypothetical protein A6K24_06485 [Metabacillus litoralis]|uniref:Uncharacterized protein n=1 Tax=Metabacillus litoralis TaxID=152268 RepID=A0A179SXX5_9BACI|nr:hypothetical protein A6K24_06485 [Metabacillus litoralis]